MKTTPFLRNYSASVTVLLPSVLNGRRENARADTYPSHIAMLFAISIAQFF
jgi:hypothetical protein